MKSSKHFRLSFVNLFHLALIEMQSIQQELYYKSKLAIRDVKTKICPKFDHV